VNSLLWLIIFGALFYWLHTRLQILKGRIEEHDAQLAALRKKLTQDSSSRAALSSETIPPKTASPTPGDIKTPKPPAQDYATSPSQPVANPLYRRDTSSDGNIDSFLSKIPTISLEEFLGTRIFVWIGGVALILAGAYFVKYSIDSGLLSPAARIGMGTVTALSFLGAGEFMRLRSLRVAQGLSAAGIGNLFGIILAATKLYQFLPDVVGFLLLAATAGGAVVLSLRQGPIVAVLGLIGGFATPALVGSGDSHPAFLFGYLLLLQMGLLSVARIRQWLGIAIATMLFLNLWSAIWVSALFETEHSLWYAFFLLGSGFIVFIISHPTEDGRQPGWGALPIPVHWGFILVLLACTTIRNDFLLIDWMFCGIVGLASMALGRWKSTYRYLSVLGTAVPAALYLFALTSSDGKGFAYDLAIGTGFALSFSIISFALLWQSKHETLWATLSVLSGIGYFLIIWSSIPELNNMILGLVAIGGSALLAAALQFLRRLRPQIQQWHGAMVAFAVGTTGFASLAIYFLVPAHWHGGAYALEIAALGMVEARIGSPALPTFFGKDSKVSVLRALSMTLLSIVLISVFQEGLPDQNDTAGSILITFAVPILALFLGAQAFRARGVSRSVKLLEHTAVLLSVVLLLLEIGQGLEPFTPIDFKIEIGARFLGVLFLSLALMEAHRLYPRSAFVHFAIGLGCLVGMAKILHEGIFANPLLFKISIESFWLILGLNYLMPALALALLAERLKSFSTVTVRQFLRVSSLTLVFWTITLLIRYGFNGDALKWTAIGDAAGEAGLAEIGTYPLAWLVLGSVTLWLGNKRKDLVLNYAAIVIMALAAIFIVVAAGIQGNPWLREISVGEWPVINWVLWIYGLPAALCFLFTAGVKRFTTLTRPFERLARILSAAGYVFLLMTVTYEVAQYFRGPILPGHYTGAVETYSYSAAWLILGSGVLIYGVKSNSLVERYGGLAILTLTIGKVFFFDTSELTGLYRVTSFLGLGLSLLGLAYIFQRFVNRQTGAADGSAAKSL
jgi:uncharacterized membrane protein